MAASMRSDIELLTEHFGYPPVSLLDDIINSINILAERAVNSIEQGLLNAPPASLGFRPPTHSAEPSASTTSKGKSKNAAADGLPNAEEARRHEIEAGTHQLETLLFASIDKNFDVFEIYVMRNILCVRPSDRDWIRLSHYENLDFAPSPAGGADTPSLESVSRLRRRLQASQKLSCMLHAEKARNASLLASLRALVAPPSPIKSEEASPAPAPLAFLQSQGALAEGGADAPVTTTTAFTLSQLQALRALSTSLRNILPDLAERDAGGQDEQERKGSWRRERLEYVEAATRRHLENVRGLDLGAGGEVRDGEWDGGGRSLGQGEVEGLEGVVGVLGGGTQGKGGDKMDES
ncbi:Mis12 protein-domain-containing protein [Lasiosphaeris hirsuta]|uniref:Mis12 protein-domain-containing protein n=1 Tax=Lasiosphaeris hirsuta TaxID=260670 RepID=A0AA40DPU4_9PEZI|nr:Mis12 protein-domain-containing protein [Lasiosphaeris hirsuta]